MSLLSELQVREARPDEAAGILEIYNDAVRHTMAIWNEVPVDLSNRIAWMQERQAKGYPVLVAVDAREAVLGYASFGDWRAFEGFRHTVEHSVYVHAQARGRRIGEALMRALIERAAACDKHVMVGAIEAGNTASLNLHRRLGFEQTGLLKEVGTKFGRWLDLIFVQKTLD